MATEKDVADKKQQAAVKPKKELLDGEKRSESETFRSERSPAELELEESSKGSSDSLSPGKGVPGWTNR